MASEEPKGLNIYFVKDQAKYQMVPLALENRKYFTKRGKSNPALSVHSLLKVDSY